MAENQIKILLGYDDEQISEKYQCFVNFTTNKIGGRPDWPSNTKLDPPKCPLCLLPRLLVVQIYSPIETTTYHRTLYVFACINPNCWNQNESWICVRAQSLEQVIQPEEGTALSPASSRLTVTSTGASGGGITKTTVTEWCADADDWDDDDDNSAHGGGAGMGTAAEENGNIIGSNMDKVSDEDDESCSFEESLRAGFEHMTVDERNANNGGVAADPQGGGAVGRLHSPSATAEIEAGEGDVISIDTPTMPQADLAALLNETTPLPDDRRPDNQLQFEPYFVSVADEYTNNSQAITDRHIRELLQVYQQNGEDAGYGLVNAEGAAAAVAGGGGGGGEITMEKYEKSLPAHGDKMFHHFVMKIQENPGHILRHGRESSTPLLLYPVQELPNRCQYCNSDMVFEFQILPTLIPKLRLQGEKQQPQGGARVEFGNVMIYTCRKSCWSTDTDVRQECVIVQKEMY